MIQSIYFSFTDYSLLEPAQWIGLRNFEKIFMDDTSFTNSLKATLWFVAVSVPLKMAVALLLAVVLNMKLRAMHIYRTVIYFPSLIGASVAVAILWSNIFGTSGLLNQMLSIFHIEGKNWISLPETALGTLIVLAVWQFGSAMVIFLAGLKQIPGEYYEASAVDGAGKIRTFISITLPLLSPIILFNLVLQTISSFQMFTQAFIITKGGPVESTYMYALYLFDKAFARFQMGYASALAWILLVMIAVVTALIFATSRAWVHYESEGGK
ncbi:sugar ABC transporter permease [Paenibacillus piri]|uniref:Sugar ABC transporter permease n=2 Tax=Paenibacillus piri TaxID=2547395 RepID=A0A4R5KAL2_9BACL|nr:sugar ABC transporter permease [Paenibacillus piri]